MSFVHMPVMLNEAIVGLSIKPQGIYIDGTVGGGGHALLIAEKLGEKGLLIGIDRDQEAVAVAKERLMPSEAQTHVLHGNYREMKLLLAENSIKSCDGILLDLGVSSHQLDQANRGFSYISDASLDMRMDQQQKKNACDIVNNYGEADLHRIIREYGEERFAKRIARFIVSERSAAAITTTGRLSDIVASAIPAKFRADGGHPAKRTFQALRIECNDELRILEETLDEMIDILNPGGRLVIITFHSLEDRIVKVAFRRNEYPCICPADFPVCGCGKTSRGKVITRKPLTPSQAEMESNKRAKSAKLRVFERHNNI
ncbi:MAG: 16S rRNA (cytosine(1402)-N(4))-methyltransferase RsmH [Lachnospiraceae bacterium]|jgi:16S rRNA (cytosine1402-N4)-methyltransferase|nr:16S rRNA (cytosine(1402)-N(4))-methyltransferase RsmH [Lachnospiraceae bacterium]